jgi:hypothetical protein
MIIEKDLIYYYFSLLFLYFTFMHLKGARERIERKIQQTVYAVSCNKISKVEILRASVADYSKRCSDSSPNIKALLL